MSIDDALRNVGVPSQDPQSQVETQLIRKYIEDRHHDPDQVLTATDEASKSLLRAASLHASSILAQLDSRSHAKPLIRDLRPAK